MSNYTKAATATASSRIDLEALREDFPIARSLHQMNVSDRQAYAEKYGVTMEDIAAAARFTMESTSPVPFALV